jgi:hypothetical protein
LDGYAVTWGNSKNVSLQTDDNGDTYLHIVGDGATGHGTITYLISLPCAEHPSPYVGVARYRTNANIGENIRIGDNAHNSIPSDGEWHNVAATVSNTDARLSLGTEYFLSTGEYLDIKLAAEFAPPDWQAMQARGITWFDGDSQSPQPNAGLSYGPDGRGLSYGVSAGGERNLAVLSNYGTTNAYPTLTVTGPFPDGVEIQTGVGGVIRYTGAVGMVPLVIQCDPRNAAASMGGVDVGRYLTGRDLPAIPANGSMSLRLMSAGSGWVTVTTHDTYL